MSDKGLYTEVHCQVLVGKERDFDTASEFTTGWVTGREGEVRGGGGGGRMDGEKKGEEKGKGEGTERERGWEGGDGER